jgi:hypothetical protein
MDKESKDFIRITEVIPIHCRFRAIVSPLFRFLFSPLFRRKLSPLDGVGGHAGIDCFCIAATQSGSHEYAIPAHVFTPGFESLAVVPAYCFTPTML